MAVDLSPRIFQDLAGVIASQSIGPQQRAAFDNPRVAKIRDALINTLTSGGTKSLTQADRDLIDMVISFVVAQGIIPGAHDTGQQYAEILSAIQLADNNSKAITNPDFYTTGALNAQSVLNDITFNNDGSYNTAVTSGMNAELTSTVGARILEDVLVESQYSGQPAFEEVDFGSNATQMQRSVDKLIEGGNIRYGGSAHKRFSKQQRQVQAMEYAAAAEFLFNQSADGKVGGITREQFDTMSVEKKKAFIDENAKRGDDGNFKFVDKNNQTVSHQQVMHTFLNDENTKNDVKYGNEIMGERIDYDAFHRAQQQTYGESKETVLTARARESAENRMARSSENIQFLSKTFGTDSFDAVQQIADDLNLGSLTSESNIKNVKAQLRQAVNVALATNRDIKDVLQERADLIKALAPDHGGQQYVNSKFVSQVQLMRASTRYQQDEAGVALKSDEEQIAAAQRSYNNTINQFGGIALAQYTLDNMDHLPEETRKRLQEQVDEGNRLLKEGDRAGARAVASQLDRELSFLSPAHKRQAYSTYGADLNEASVDSGLREQVTHALSVALKNGHLQLFGEDVSDDKKAEGLKVAQQSAEDLLKITGSDAQDIGYLRSDLSGYSKAQTPEEREQYVKDLKKQLVEERFYSEDEAETYIKSIQNLTDAGIDANNFGSFLKFATENTETFSFGKSAKRKEFAAFSDSISARKNKSYGMEDIGDLIVAGIYGDGAQNIDSDEAMELEYSRYLKEKGLDKDGNLIGNVKDFFNNKTDDITAAYLGNMNKQGQFVDDKGNVINDQVANSLWEDEDFQKLLKDNNIDVDEAKFKENITKGGARFLREFAEENNLELGDIGGELFITDASEYANRAIKTNKELETLRNLDLEPYLGEVRDDKGNVTQKKGEITTDEFTEITKKLYGDNKSDYLDDEGKFKKGTLFEGKTEQEALAFLNDSKGNAQGLTNAEQMHAYKLKSTEITESTIQKQTEGIVGALGSLGELVGNILKQLTNNEKPNNTVG